MSGTCKHGFTLIELLVAIAIVAVMATVVVPQLFQRGPAYERKKFIGQLNALTRFTWQQALTKNKLHQVFFDFQKQVIAIKEQTDEQDSAKQSLFSEIKAAGLRSSIEIPQQFQVKQFLIEGSNAMAAFAGRPTEQVWFFVPPDGLSQEVVINMVDIKDRLPDGSARQMGLVLNPFTVQFKVYDEFQ